MSSLLVAVMGMQICTMMQQPANLVSRLMNTTTRGQA